MAFFDNKETKTTMKIDNSEYVSGVTFSKHTDQKEVHRFISQKEDWFKISVSVFLQSQN